ncbi:MerR family transcriptional regulator [Gordonia sp. DT30]|uniref:DNA polymerase III subunit beta family protein n=1 Tax=unclassified Gordonia (in: high G+C Gram-positive bacteria) TaxID=2657482 RepID=UPI003CF60059
MEDPGLMPIGSFARRSGLTASALRFYADAGVLIPTEVDPASGYRFYATDQLERASLLRQLREIGMPLATARSVLTADCEEAVRLVDDHVDAVVGNAVTARERAATIKSALVETTATMVATVSGPVLAAAVAQVLTATTDEPDVPVLGGVRIEADAGTVVVTATDRYRLSIRTLVSTHRPGPAWAATVNGEDLRDCLTDLRRTPQARIEATDHEIWIRMPTRGDRHCRLLTETFPDYQLMLDELPPPTTRVESPKTMLLQRLEERSTGLICLRVNNSGISLYDTSHDMHGQIPGRVSGPGFDVWFEMTTLYPAISTAIGADVVFDLRGATQPATIRSADNGDLTTLVMPTMPPFTEDGATPKEHHE